MFVWTALMEYKRFLFLLPVGLALLLCTSVVVGSASPTAFGQQQPNLGGNQNMTSTTNTGNNTGTSSAGTLDCDNAASVLGGMAVPNPAGVCDIAVPLQGAQVQNTSTGPSLNKLPIMIFVHAIANGDINTLTKDTRTILDSLMAQMQSSSSNQTSTTGGGTTGGNMTSNSTPGGVTGGTTTGSGSTAGGGAGTFGGGGESSPSPGVGTSDGSGSDGTTTGGAAGPQVRP